MVKLPPSNSLVPMAYLQMTVWEMLTPPFLKSHQKTVAIWKSLSHNQFKFWKKKLRLRFRIFSPIMWLERRPLVSHHFFIFPVKMWRLKPERLTITKTPGLWVTRRRLLLAPGPATMITLPWKRKWLGLLWRPCGALLWTGPWLSIQSRGSKNRPATMIWLWSRSCAAYGPEVKRS